MRRLIELLVIVVVTGAALWWGGSNAYVAWREGHALEISCADWIAQRPEARWLRLTDCEADIDHLAQEITSSERVGVEIRGSRHTTAVYLALRPKGVTAGPVHIVVRRSDPDILAVASNDSDDARTADAASRVRASLAQPVVGLVDFGLDMSSRERGALDALGLGLAQDFIIVQGGARPMLGFALVILVLGLGGLGAAAWLARDLLHRHAGKQVE